LVTDIPRETSKFGSDIVCEEEEGFEEVGCEEEGFLDGNIVYIAKSGKSLELK